MDILESCAVCPRECRINRTVGVGFCGAGKNVKIARAALHHWEEPCISGKSGSGAVFFAGCNLKCVYCQNFEISRGDFGKVVSVKRLSEIFLELQQQGAHNINLVSPTPYIPQICEAIDCVRSNMHIPFVYNTGGYEKVKSLQSLKGYIDIYLTDIKYFSPELSAKYSGVSDYFEKAFDALEEMINQTKTSIIDNAGIMKSGVIIRHLVLPGFRRDSEKILEMLALRFSPNDFVLSLMSQFTPNGQQLKDYPELNRRITTFEYNSVVDAAIRLGFEQGYTQNRSSAKQKYTPPFDLSGV